MSAAGYLGLFIGGSLDPFMLVPVLVLGWLWGRSRIRARALLAIPLAAVAAVAWSGVGLLVGYSLADILHPRMIAAAMVPPAFWFLAAALTAAFVTRGRAAI